ncbi:DUF945 family protein, partial [Pseudomonas sp. SIMBA_044]|uniref:DUF945 family protein n=1 Tax=Pseudomonas sp. SIMBA_044 TaxID=3085785 RepID=UPI00397A0721
LLSAQAQLAGTTDPADIPHLAKMSSEWIGLKAVQTGLATVKDDTIRASLVYSAGQVDLNDQKMTVEEFLNLLLTLSGQLTPH